MCDIVTDVFRFIRSGRRKDNWQKCAGFANVNVLKWITTYRLHSFVRSGLKHFLASDRDISPHIIGFMLWSMFRHTRQWRRQRICDARACAYATKSRTHPGFLLSFDWISCILSTLADEGGRKGSYRLDKFLFGHELFKTYHICFSWICQNQPDTGVWHTRAS